MGTLVNDGDVFIAEWIVDYEGGDFLGVFGSLALAKNACNAHRARSSRPMPAWVKRPRNLWLARDYDSALQYVIRRVAINQHLPT